MSTQPIVSSSVPSPADTADSYPAHTTSTTPSSNAGVNVQLNTDLPAHSFPPNGSNNVDATAPATTPAQDEWNFFPDEGYIGLAGDFAELASRYMESPKQLLYIDALTVIGIAFSGLVTLDLNQPRIYALKIVPTGTSRKSSSTDEAVKFVKAAVDKARHAPVQPELEGGAKGQDNAPPPAILDILHGIGSGEALIKRFATCQVCGRGRSNNIHNAGTDKKPNLQYDHEFVDNNHILLVFDEHRHMEKKSLNGATLGDTCTTLFGKNEISNDTVTNGRLKATNCHLGVISNTTDANFNNLLNARELVDTGGLNRYLTFTGKRTKRHWRYTGVPDDKLAPLVAKLASYFTMYRDMGGVELAFTPDAAEVFKSWSDNLEDSADTVRLDTHAWRLLMILTIAQGRTSIDVATVNATLAIIRYVQQVRVKLQPSSGNQREKLDEMKRKVVRKLTDAGPLNKSKLRAAFHIDRPKAGLVKADELILLDRALTELTKDGSIEEVLIGKKRVWQLKGWEE